MSELPVKSAKILATLLLLALTCLAYAQTGNPPSRENSPVSVGASESVPQRYTLSPERTAQATAYARARRWLYFIDFTGGIVALLLVLRWRIGVVFRRWAESASRRRILQAAIFTPLLMMLLEIAGLPSAMALHWLALRHRISVQGWPSWFLDLSKGSLLQFAVGILLVWVLYAVMRRSPRRWWLYTWVAVLPLLIFAVFISPWLVDPLFFDFAPLAPSHPTLAAQIERITARAGEEIPQSRMYVMNASSKLNALNAYVTGLGASRRVVVWDTTIAKLSEPEVLSVFSHEMGHYVLGHVRKGVIFAAAMILLGLFVGSRLFRWIVNRWGALWGLRGIGDWASLPALLLIFSLLSFVVTPAANAYSRYIEHQADVYGLEVLHGVIPDSSAAAARSLQIMGEEDLEEPSPSRAVVFWFYTHPPINDRIVFANSYDPWTARGTPEFVK